MEREAGMSDEPSSFFNRRIRRNADRYNVLVYDVCKLVCMYVFCV